MSFAKKYFMSICGIVTVILGILAICLGNSVYYSVSYEHNKSYGGDAYTGIQNAAAKTANNVNYLGSTYAETYTLFMTFVGVTMIAGGVLTTGYNIIENFSKKKKNSENN